MNTEIIITDISGSMAPIMRDAIGGINTFLEEQKKVPGEARVSAFYFSNIVAQDLDAVDLKSIRTPIGGGIIASGMTALNDAIGTALDRCGRRIAEQKWADSVIVMVTTDGQENCSTDYGAARIREMVKHAEDHGWKFIFAAANQDAVMAAQGVGITRGVAANYSATAQGSKDLYASMSVTVTSMRAGADNVGAVAGPISSLSSPAKVD